MARRAVIHGRKHRSAVVDLDEVSHFYVEQADDGGSYALYIVSQDYEMPVRGLTEDSAIKLRAMLGRLISGQLVEGVLEVDGDLGLEAEEGPAGHDG